MAHYALDGRYQVWTQSTTMEHRLAWAICFTDSEASPNPPAPETFLEDLSDDQKAALCLLVRTQWIPHLPSRPTSVWAMVLSTLPFRSIPRSEWLAQEKRKYADRLVERQDKVARFEQLKSQKKAKRRQYERNRKRVRRAQQKQVRAAAQAAKKLALDTKAGNNLVLDLLDARQTISSLSRPYSRINAAISRQDSSRPSRRQTPLQPTRRINWCQDIYWNLIDTTARAVGYPWRPIDIVKRLRLIDADTFQFLRPQRISQWRDHWFPDELQWTESHLQAIKAEGRPGVTTGRCGIF
ncbi:hypothetical protein FRC09_012132, partial [Ceratobasidium sp. 395]